MKFSLVIPVFNVAPYLCDCLDSVLNQTFGDWEAICVNDGSTDCSEKIVEEYAKKDPRIHCFSKSNGGTSSARNVGLKEAKGDYIVFLDGDDWLELNALQAISEHLKNEEILCFSGRRFFEETNTYHLADRLEEKEYHSGMDYYNDNALAHRDFAFVCVVLRVYQRRFLMERQLFFDDNVSYEDNLWVPITLFYAHTVSVISDDLYVYRIRQGSKMQEVSLVRKKDLMKVANILASFFVPKNGFDKTTVYRAITHHYQAVFKNMLKSERKELYRLCDWCLYRKVSRTKLRHRVNYLKNRVAYRLSSFAG